VKKNVLNPNLVFLGKSEN